MHKQHSLRIIFSAVNFLCIWLVDVRMVKAGECVNDATRLGVYLPNFSGDATISESATTVVHLRLLQELRRSTPDQMLQFGCAKIGWGRSRLDNNFGDRARLEEATPVAIWGHVEKVADGGVVSFVLTRIRAHDLRKLRPEVWNVELHETTIDLDLVQSSYGFKPVIIPSSVMGKYSSKSYLRICATKSDNCGGEKIGNADISAIINEGKYTYVKVSDRRKGWILMPQWDSNNDVLPFISGLIYLMRGDFLKARPMLERVAGSEGEAAVRMNALLIGAAILEREGENGREVIQRARQLNPFAKFPIQVGVMSLLGRASMTSGDDRHGLIVQARGMLIEGSKLFDPKDKWFKGAKRATGLP